MGRATCRLAAAGRFGTGGRAGPGAGRRAPSDIRSRRTASCPAMGSPGLRPGSAWPGATTLFGGVTARPDVWAGTDLKISPGRNSGFRGSPGLAARGSGEAGAGIAGGAGVRRCSGLSGAAGIADAGAFGRSARVTGGGNRSAAEGRSGVVSSAGGGAGAGTPGSGGAADTVGPGSAGGAEGASVTLGASARSSTAVRTSFSSSCRKGETFASTTRALRGGGSNEPAPTLRRLDSCSVSAPPSGGVIGDDGRRNGGGRGGAMGRSFPLLEIGGGSVGTDFRVSVLVKGC